MRYKIVLCALLWPAISSGAPFREGLAVETDSPDALCPDLVTTREAIHNRLGTLTLESGNRQGWTVRYTVGHAPGTDGDFVRLQLLDPAGQSRISRDLPVGGDSCATLAQAMALVIERYFRELETPALSPSDSDQRLASERSSSLAASPASTVSAPARPPVPTSTPQLMLGLGLGFASAQPGAIAGLQGGAWLGRQVHLELGLLADLGAHHEQLQSAPLELRSFPVQLELGFGQREQSWELFAGPEARWTLQLPQASGLVGFDSTPGAAFSMGLAAGSAFWPSAGLGITLRASLDYTLAGTKFKVETPGASPQQVLKMPALQALLTLGVAFGGSP
ncbi:MAG TPA: hypothetical protein VGL19_04075 [Polyangiaceae bacterium]